MEPFLYLMPTRTVTLIKAPYHHSNLLGNENNVDNYTMGKDYYAVLGITRDSTDTSIKKA